MSIKKASSSTTKPSRPAPKSPPPKPASKPSQNKSSQSSESKTSQPSRESNRTEASRQTDEIRISNEARESRSSRPSREASRSANEESRAEETNKPTETDAAEETPGVNDAKPTEEVEGEAAAKPETEESGGLREELEEIKDLLAGLTDNFRNGAAEEAAAAPSGGAPSGGSPSEEGGESQQAQAPAPVNPMQNMNQAQMNGGIDAQLTQLATQIIMLTATGQGGGMGAPGMGMPGANGFGGPGMGMPGGNGFGGPGMGMPGMNNFGMGNPGAQGFGNPMANGLMGGGPMTPVDALKNKLGAVYQQSGGMNNPSVRPETHQLVQLALGGGGATGLNLGVFPGMNGMGPGVNAQMGMNPQFGSVSPAPVFGMASGF